MSVSFKVASTGSRRGWDSLRVDGWGCLIACYPGALLQGRCVITSSLIKWSQKQRLFTSEFIRLGKDPSPLLNYKNPAHVLQPPKITRFWHNCCVQTNLLLKIRHKPHYFHVSLSMCICIEALIRGVMVDFKFFKYFKVFQSHFPNKLKIN